MNMVLPFQYPIYIQSIYIQSIYIQSIYIQSIYIQWKAFNGNYSTKSRFI